MLCNLPNEVILQVLQYVSNENHVDLIPIASTCKRMRALVADWTIWSGSVTIVIDSSSPYSTSQLYAPMAQVIAADDSLSSGVAPRATHVNLAIDNPNACTQLPNLLHRLLNSGNNEHMKSLALYTPTSTHEAIIEHVFQALPSMDSSSTEKGLHSSCIESITLRDPLLSDAILLDHQPIVPLAASTNINFKHALMHWLAQSCKSLLHLDIPSLPIAWFTEDGGNACFEKLETLTVTMAYSGNDDDEEEQEHGLDGRMLKQMFPCLKELAIHLPCADQFSLLLPLLSDKQLYPWIESITVICPDDDKLRKNLPQEDVKSLLSSLKGVSRINAGWDMVVLDEI
ncbi:hypothetical protein K492DRAFT_190846 [Lichtheimia hyalospora FSU 10163]|nr:hypothetical protein K492DRAFT_190846 [Lichtheimia hyalospora FSU 10163]